MNILPFNWFWKPNTYWFYIRKSILYQFDAEPNTHYECLFFIRFSYWFCIFVLYE